MFQTYDDRGGPEGKDEHIAKLRDVMAKARLDGMIIPRSDPFMNEYVSPHDERLLWLTGFSGSAGLAIILAKTAAIFIDGRYRLQVEDQVNTTLLSPVAIEKTKPTEWLKNQVQKNMVIGIDARLHSVESYTQFDNALEQQGAKLRPLKSNPIDKIWLDQPAETQSKVDIHPKKYAGRDPIEKIVECQNIIKKLKVDAAILSNPASVSWLFNLRARDVPHTPLVLGRAILHLRAKPEIFISSERLSDKVKAHITKWAKLYPPERFEDQLKQLGKSFKKVLIDPHMMNASHYQTLRAARAEIVRGNDPCSLPKAIKNDTEIAGMKVAHHRDGVAMCQFLHWLKGETKQGEVDEILAAKTLEAFRRSSGRLKDISFETISGAGPNGAIVHYRVSEKTNRRLIENQLYLTDSGGQYLDGTTDITRTVIIGKPSREMRRHYTLVLKGHIDLATAAFPPGTRGCDLDPIARRALWKAGLDYAHGTGHGVGYFLSVHEGPQNISRRGTAVLKPGMIISNEPGFYKEGAYGIRLENLILVKEAEAIPGGEQEMMCFETLTLAPFDRQLIEPSLLNQNQLDWLNRYHKKVRQKIGPDLSPPVSTWLKKVTKAIS